MVWTEAHDNMLCREIIANDPFTGSKKGTIQRSAKWSEIADNLMSIMNMNEPFKVDKRAVRERYNLLAEKFRRKLKQEEKASGIECHMTECEQALECIIEKEDASEMMQKENTDKQKEKVTAERAAAEEVRQKAMEKLSTTKKRMESQDGNDINNPKKRRSSGSETIVFLREKNEQQLKMAQAEMELRQKQIDLDGQRHTEMMTSMQQQQQLQLQSFQLFMAQQQQQQQQFQQQQNELMVKMFEMIPKK